VNHGVQRGYRQPLDEGIPGAAKGLKTPASIQGFTDAIDFVKKGAVTLQT